ncbi:MAG TPA: PmoA family protein [Bryobacteraceae bacterium]|nr:PmoA family protein [Bryobacteraceae bacterium]
MTRATLPLLAALASACLAADPVSFAGQPGRIHVSIEGKPFTTMLCSADQDKPFLHPLRTSTGIVVTRGWPIDPAPGDSTDHPHQRGLWWAHGLTNGVDFWTNGPKTGRYELKTSPKADPKTGSIRTELNMASPDGRVHGSLVEEYAFSALGSARVVDVFVRILADRGAPVKLGDTREGAMAVRVCEELNESRGASLLNSEGGVGEKQIWGKRARWVDYSGKVGGQVVGVAMFDHPSNPKFPTYWMARGYGLLAANCFGESEFTEDKTRDGSLTIPAGGSLGFRHRVLIHLGDAKEAAVEKLYQQWARK